MRHGILLMALLAASGPAFAQAGAMGQLQASPAADGSASFDGTKPTSGVDAPSASQTAQFTPPPQPERDAHEKEVRKAGWIGGGIGAGVGILLFGGLALGGVLPWAVMLAGVPAFALLGFASGEDYAG